LLVVDDDRDLRSYMVRLLEKRGLVRTAASSDEALEIAQAWQPDLMLIDVAIPGLNGLALLTAIRADARLRSMSVILISGWIDDEIRTWGLRAGADDVVVKPFTVGELTARVDGQLWLARMRSETWAAAERERLAFDLHDSVTQSVYSLTLLAESVRRAASRGDHGKVDEGLARLSDTAQRSLREMRLLVSQLRPTLLPEVGLVKALEQRLETVERRAGLTARIIVTGDSALSPLAEEELYLITQEALNNTLKHANATTVVVHITGRPGVTELIVADNGRGFDPTEVDGSGVGLVSMRERAARIGATVDIGHRRRGGTRVLVRLPTADQALPDVQAGPPGSTERRERGWTGRSAS
jgi:signal transduction histidine kinase